MFASGVQPAGKGNMTHTVTPVVKADSPQDGGKWAIYCEHMNANGEIFYTAVLQDTNKSRLAQWRNHSSEWCYECSNESEA